MQDFPHLYFPLKEYGGGEVLNFTLMAKKMQIPSPPQKGWMQAVG